MAAYRVGFRHLWEAMVTHARRLGLASSDALVGVEGAANDRLVRGDYEGADRAFLAAARGRISQQRLIQGNQEGCGLAGSSLGYAEQVAALEQRGDGLGLDGGRLFITFARQSAKQRLGKTEMRKKGQ